MEVSVPLYYGSLYDPQLLDGLYKVLLIRSIHLELQLISVVLMLACVISTELRVALSFRS